MTDSRKSAGCLLAIGALLLASCGEGTADSPGAATTPLPSAAERNLVAAGYEGRFAVTATVLESPDHGPQLCGNVAESYPPQCTGPDIAGWDWDAVESESASGTTWGEYQLVGTWDGGRFTLTEPAQPATPDSARPPLDVDFRPPCPEPEGGWRPVDPTTTTEVALQEAFARAATIPSYAGGWVYHADDHNSSDVGGGDPTRIVLVLRFTEDPAQAEQAIRELWGGPLCVTGADRTEADLNEIQSRVRDQLPAAETIAPDPVRNAVTVGVLVGTTEQQAELDARYGEGAVLLYGMLQPID